jgi:hypothetical protein
VKEIPFLVDEGFVKNDNLVADKAFVLFNGSVKDYGFVVGNGFVKDNNLVKDNGFMGKQSSKSLYAKARAPSIQATASFEHNPS